MDGPAFTNNVSMIFNKVYQEQQLKNLQKRLSSDQNNVLATILSERLKSSFGLRALPSLDDVQPLIHFDESGQTHFTLIYTSSLLSPFALICSHYFGHRMMNLQRLVYHMLYTNTLNISDSDAEGEETAASNQPPPVLSYANGVARDSMYEKSCSSSKSVGKEADESVLRDEVRDGGGDEDSGESLLSYSMSSLISPAAAASVRCGDFADSASAKQQTAHDSLACTVSSERQTVRREERQRSGAISSAHHVKKYKCDRCSKSFSVRSHLDSHKVTHTGEKKYKCSRCGNRFTQSSSLRNHMIAIHTRNFPHVCTLCSPPKGFLLPSQLRKHNENSHRKH